MVKQKNQSLFRVSAAPEMLQPRIALALVCLGVFSKNTLQYGLGLHRSCFTVEHNAALHFSLRSPQKEQRHDFHLRAHTQKVLARYESEICLVPVEAS